MKEITEQKHLNLLFWAPFIISCGAALYFTMGQEPDVMYPVIAFIASIIILIFGKINFVLRGLILFLGGFLYAIIYTQYFVSTPILKHDIRDTEIVAHVTDIDISDDKTRLVLSVDANDLGLHTKQTAKIKATVINDINLPDIGDVIKTKISVFSPSPMEAPESFDYARWAYFNNLTATGFIPYYEVLSHQDITNVNKLRTTVHEKANSFLTDGLILGYKNAVPKIDKEIWTTTGIGHIWSISGFHLTLIGGWLFLFFYLICRSISFITKRVPARIIATMCAWFVLLGYVFISGASVATWRAFLMVTLGFIALLFGRNAISMRNICIAFLILFCVNPHFVTQAGFQLSFAAIFGLIWFFGDKKFDKANKSYIEKLKTWIYVATMTAIIATIFTLPFIATHFSSVPLYSLLGNLIFVPIFSFIIMPLVILGTVCAMFGGHMLLNWATVVYDFSINIAHKITDLPLANLTMPHISNIAFIILIFGFACLIFIKPLCESRYWIYRKINYILFVICISVGIVIIAVRPKPVFYVTSDHELIGMVYDEKLEFNKARASNHYFAFDAFRKLNNEHPADTNTRRKCPDGVCIYETDNFKLAYIQKFIPLQKHIVNLCRDETVDYIVSYFDVSAPRCNHKILHNGFVIYKSGHIQYTPTNRWWHNPRE